jgi:hypothetical protein
VFVVYLQHSRWGQGSCPADQHVRRPDVREHQHRGQGVRVAELPTLDTGSVSRCGAALVAVDADAGQRQLHPANAEAALAPNVGRPLTTRAHSILRMLDVPGAFSGTGPVRGACVRYADDLLLGGEPRRVTVVDVQIGEPIAPLGDDVRLVGAHHGSTVRDADGGGD